jgi:cell wall-associated NlpC family hydrolase
MTAETNVKALGPLTRDAVVARARSATGKGTVYSLGEGGREPALPTPGHRCDCSGFAAWCVGVDRYLPNDDLKNLMPGEAWFETSTLARDARSPFGFVAEVPWLAALPGDLLVYPDRSGHQGHVGVVATVDHAGPLSVVHCSLGNFHHTNDAIRETPVELFRLAGAIVARVAWVQ